MPTETDLKDEVMDTSSVNGCRNSCVSFTVQPCDHSLLAWKYNTNKSTTIGRMLLKRPFIDTLPDTGLTYLMWLREECSGSFESYKTLQQVPKTNLETVIGVKGHRAVGYCLVPKHGFNKLLTLERRSTTNEEHKLQKKRKLVVQWQRKEWK